MYWEGNFAVPSAGARDATRASRTRVESVAITLDGSEMRPQSPPNAAAGNTFSRSLRSGLFTFSAAGMRSYLCTDGAPHAANAFGCGTPKRGSDAPAPSRVVSLAQPHEHVLFVTHSLHEHLEPLTSVANCWRACRIDLHPEFFHNGSLACK